MHMNLEGQRFKGAMPLSKISLKRQVVIPEDICEVIGAEVGDYIEFIRRDDEIIIKAKKLVDATPAAWGDVHKSVPPPQTKENRLEMIKALSGTGQDDSDDIPIEKI